MHFRNYGNLLLLLLLLLLLALCIYAQEKRLDKKEMVLKKGWKVFTYLTRTIFRTHCLIFPLKANKDEFCFISCGTIFQIFGSKYETDSCSFHTLFADGWRN